MSMLGVLTWAAASRVFTIFSDCVGGVSGLEN